MMSISLGKNSGAGSPQPSSSPPPDQMIRETIARRFSANHGADYCEADTWLQLVQTGLNAGLDSISAQNIIDMELERASIVNEKRLLEELEELLQRLSGRDKRLTEKDHKDALQLVCKSRPGFSRGLEPQVATRFVLVCCRAKHIALKTGLFQWKVP